MTFLAVCVAGAVVVVIATILGAVELLRKPVAVIAGRWGSLWTPLLIRPRLWRSLPLFPVKKFNGQEMDGRTLKVEIAKSGAPAAKTAGTAATFFNHFSSLPATYLPRVP